MSLEDSLKSAKDRADAVYNAENRKKECIARYRKAMQDLVEKCLEDAAKETYKIICDKIADKIYSSGNSTHTQVRGYLSVPKYLEIRVEDAQAYRELINDYKTSSIYI